MRTAERLRTRFAAQFAPYIYRAHDWAPGIPVSASERDRFVAGFEKYVPTLQWVCNPWLIIGAMFVLPSLVTHYTYTWVAAPVFGAILLLPASLYTWTTSAPERALKGRPPIDNGLPKDVIRANAIRKLTWPRLILDLVVVSLWLGVMAKGGEAYSPSARIIIGALNAGALLLLLRDLFAIVLHRRRPRDAAAGEADS